MNDLSSDFSDFESELSGLVAESAQINSKNDLKNILIRLTALQRIVYREINQDKTTSQDNYSEAPLGE